MVLDPHLFRRFLPYLFSKPEVKCNKLMGLSFVINLIPTFTYLGSLLFRKLEEIYQLLSSRHSILGLDLISSTHFFSVSALLPKSLDKLVLPHPRLQERTFFLMPLIDLQPDWIHPFLKVKAKEMLDSLPPNELESIQELKL